MMGMHGEAWVNHAIQEADLLIALGMRFDDRVTGNLKTYAPNAKKIHIDIDRAEINKNVRGRRRPRRRSARRARAAGCRASRRAIATTWLARINELKGDSAVRDIQTLPDDGHLVRGARHQRPLARHQRRRASSSPTSASTRCGKRSTTTTTAALAHHVGRPRHDGLRAAGGDRRQDRARPDAEVWVVVGDGGFQMTMCELATAVQERLDIKVAIINNGYLGMVRQWQEFFYERRYAATPLSGPDFVEARRGVRHRGDRRSRARGDVLPAVEAARAHAGARSLIDFRVEQEDTVYPMVPAGADLHAMIRRPSPIVETGGRC